jgi:RNA polymerase sigma-70 factor (ECF subfamily)
VLQRDTRDGHVAANELDDDELIQKISHKDLTAFRKLVERHKAFVFNTCCNLIGSFQQAEEVAQDVFLQVYQSAGSFRHQSKVSTWIYRIAVNRSFNVIRSNKRSRSIKSLTTLEIKESEGKEPDTLLEKKELRGLLRAAVDSLPEKQRTAFILNKHENLSPSEIAEILGISINSVEVRIHRAKKNLQKKLASLLA